MKNFSNRSNLGFATTAALAATAAVTVLFVGPLAGVASADSRPAPASTSPASSEGGFYGGYSDGGFYGGYSDDGYSDDGYSDDGYSDEGAADPSPDAAFDDPRATPSDEGAADPSPDAAFDDPRATPDCVFNPALALYQPCPEETTTTTVPDPTTTTVPDPTTTTVPTVEVKDETTTKVPTTTPTSSQPTGTLAFTGSSTTLLFLGIGVLLAGAVALVSAKILRNRRAA